METETWRIIPYGNLNLKNITIWKPKLEEYIYPYGNLNLENITIWKPKPGEPYELENITKWKSIEKVKF